MLSYFLYLLLPASGSLPSDADLRLELLKLLLVHLGGGRGGGGGGLTVEEIIGNDRCKEYSRIS